MCTSPPSTHARWRPCTRRARVQGPSSRVAARALRLETPPSSAKTAAVTAHATRGGAQANATAVSLTGTPCISTAGCPRGAPERHTGPVGLTAAPWAPQVPHRARPPTLPSAPDRTSCEPRAAAARQAERPRQTSPASTARQTTFASHAHAILDVPRAPRERRHARRGHPEGGPPLVVSPLKQQPAVASRGQSWHARPRGMQVARAHVSCARSVHACRTSAACARWVGGGGVRACGGRHSEAMARTISICC